jgi:hypothetical protein
MIVARVPGIIITKILQELQKRPISNEVIHTQRWQFFHQGEIDFLPFNLTLDLL